MEQVLPVRVREQAGGLGWEGAAVEEAVWAATNQAQAPAEIAYVRTAGQRRHTKQASHVMRSSVPSVDHK